MVEPHDDDGTSSEDQRIALQGLQGIVESDVCFLEDK